MNKDGYDSLDTTQASEVRGLVLFRWTRKRWRELFEHPDAAPLRARPLLLIEESDAYLSLARLSIDRARELRARALDEHTLIHKGDKASEQLEEDDDEE